MYTETFKFYKHLTVLNHNTGKLTRLDIKGSFRLDFHRYDLWLAPTGKGGLKNLLFGLSLQMFRFTFARVRNI